MTVLSANPQHVEARTPSVSPDCHGQGGDGPTGRFAEAILQADATEGLLFPIVLDVPEEREMGLLATLSETEKREAGRLRRPLDRRDYVVARGRLRELLGERLGVRPAKVDLARNHYGKPGLVGRQAESGWHFNLSYSRAGDSGLALCALSRQGPIGVDVEWVRPLIYAESVARHFFSSHEYDSLQALPKDQRLLGFFLCWTRKEALVKALGRGLSYDLSAFDVSLVPGRPARILRMREGGNWSLASIGPVGNRVAAVVMQQWQG